MIETTDKVPQQMSGIESLTKQALSDVASAETPDAIEALRVALLGKHGSVTAQLKQLGALPPEQRKEVEGRVAASIYRQAESAQASGDVDAAVANFLRIADAASHRR